MSGPLWEPRPCGCRLGAPEGSGRGEVAILVDGKAAECAAQHCAQQASGIHRPRKRRRDPGRLTGCLRGSEVPVSGGV